MIRAWIIIAFLVAFPGMMYGQGTGALAGRVVEAGSGRPVAGASVFLAFTTFGAATDAEGDFYIESVPPGAYTLVISMIGYVPERIPVELAAGGVSEGWQIRLKEAVYQLEGIEVEDRQDRGWQRRYRVFEELLLGTSVYGEQARILNPEVISFDVDGTGRFSGKASEPLRIENWGLGYEITYVLHTFWYDPQTNVLRYAGAPFFTAMTPADSVQAQAWSTARNEVYLGSMAHLLAAVIAGSAYEEGFRLFEGRDGKPVNGHQLIEASAFPNQYALSFSEELAVVYRRRKPPKRRRKKRRGGGTVVEEVSRIVIHRDVGWIQADGYYHPQDLLTTFGAMGERRLADLLPRNFGAQRAITR